MRRKCSSGASPTLERVHRHEKGKIHRQLLLSNLVSNRQTSPWPPQWPGIQWCFTKDLLLKK